MKLSIDSDLLFTTFVIGVLMFFVIQPSAIGQVEHELPSQSYRLVDGKWIPAEMPDDFVILSERPSTESEINQMKLEMIANSTVESSYSWVTRNGLRIDKGNIFGGFISLDETNDLTSHLSKAEPFSNILELSPDQSLEIKKIQCELLDDLRTKAKSIKDASELTKLVRDTNIEFMRRLKTVLLPFQHSALIKYAVQSVGVLPAMVRVSDGEFLETKVDEQKFERVATNQLEKIESTVNQLKRDLAREVVNLITPNDREAIEKALACNLEDLIVKSSLENLQKQLELVKNGGVPNFSTLREFAEQLSEDTSQTPQQDKKN